MKIRAFVLSGLAIALFLSAGTEKAGLTEGNRVGDLAPRIEFLGSSSEGIDFSNRFGHYTLVNFWAAYDADSRIRNMQLWSKINKLDSTRVDVYSISMDENASVFAETLKFDRLESTNQLHEGRGRSSSLYKRYGLKKGFRNFLVDDQGVIVAEDVSLEQLSKILNKGV